MISNKETKLLIILDGWGHSEEKEYTLFTVSEYFFHKSIKNENFSSAQRAFTFYSKFIREFPKSEKIEIARAQNKNSIIIEKKNNRFQKLSHNTQRFKTCCKYERIKLFF